jgi:predicted nuclease with TOPRIM domain
MRERLEKIGEERQSSRARELASELAVAEAQAKLREAERKYSVLEASVASERGRSSRLRDEVDVLMRSVEEARQQVTAAEEGAAAARERWRAQGLAALGPADCCA